MGGCRGRVLIPQPNNGTINLFSRDYHLNTVCHDICIEGTFKCITTCDPTDSEYVYGCLRAEVTCVDSNQFYINNIRLYTCISYISYVTYKLMNKFIKAVHVRSIALVVVMVVQIQFANAR